MPDRVGVELLADRVRAVALGRFGAMPSATVELAWDPTRPDDVVRELESRLGRARHVALSVGVAFLDVARVVLPPLPPAERRRALALDTARHFAVDDETVVALLGDGGSDGSAPAGSAPAGSAPAGSAPAGSAPAGDAPGEPAFAARRPQLDAWIAAFSAWAPVECVEPAPTSLARALRGAALGDATYALAAADDEIGTIALRDGRIAAVRRVPRIALEGAPPRSLPAHGGVDGVWLAALGAALGTDAPADVQLLTDDAARTLGARRTRRVAVAAVACGAALGFALVAADRSRARTLSAVDAALAAEAPVAAPAESLLVRLAAFDAAARAAERVAARRTSVLGGLDALGTRLPTDAVVTAIRVQGDAWQIDGTARAAAAVVPALDAEPRFDAVRAAAPSSVVDEGGGARSTYSVAFRVRPAARAGR